MSVLGAVLGLVLLAGFPSTDVSGWPLAGGLACSLGAGLAFSVMTVVNRTAVAGLEPISNVGLGLLAGGVLLTPAGFVVDLSVPLAVAPLPLLGYLGLVPTVLAYLALLSVVLLGERITVLGGVGTALLVSAMLGATHRRRCPPAT